MNKLTKIAKAILLSVILIGIFALLVFSVNNFVLPLIPKNFQTWVTSYVGSGVIIISLIAGLAQITGFSMKDFISKGKKPPGNYITQVDGTHKAKGEGIVTGLDIQEPVIIKPGTKSTAEGKGTITATRISHSREENNESH